MRKGGEGENQGRLIAGSPIMSDEIGTTRFKPHDLILCRKVFDSFSHGSGPTEAFFSDQIGCETSDVGSCCAHIRVSKAWEMSGEGGGLTHGGTA